MFIIDLLFEIFKMYLEMAPYILLGLFFVASFNLLISKEIIARHIGKNNIWSIFKAALFGVPLPLCSCGVIPSAVYLGKNGASKGSTISFLISTPQTGIDSIIATYGMMGPIFAIYRPIAALVMGIFGGIMIKLFDKEQPKPAIKNPMEISFDLYKKKEDAPVCGSIDIASNKSLTFSEKLKKSLKYSFFEFVDDISIQFVTGVVISGIISYLVPNDFFKNLGLESGFLAMLIMVAVGIPMYVCATASIPIALTLMMKGFSPGVAFVFLVTGPASNAASISILTKTLGKKVVSLYLITIVIMAIIFGYLLDFLFSLFNWNPHEFMNHNHVHDSMQSPILIIATVIFTFLLLNSLWKKAKVKFNLETRSEPVADNQIIIEGMTCNHCVDTVTKSIEKIAGVENVVVSLNDKRAYINGKVNILEIIKIVNETGYTAKMVK